MMRSMLRRPVKYEGIYNAPNGNRLDVTWLVQDKMYHVYNMTYGRFRMIRANKMREFLSGGMKDSV